MLARFSRLLTVTALATLAVTSCTRELPLHPMRADFIAQDTGGPPPPNDDRNSARFVPFLPYFDSTDVTNATVESGEPTSFCHDSIAPPTRTVWYLFVSHRPGTVQLTTRLFGPAPGIVTAYFDSAGTGLLPVGCNSNFGPVTFNADSGMVFFFQVSDSAGATGPTVFSLQQDTIGPPPPPPPPQASFFTQPFDPSTFDLVQFIDQSFDPAGIGIQSQQWSFGDGATGTGFFTTHRYAADGDYLVQLTVTTFDGRTGSTSRILQVRTRDVAITRFQTPATGMTGKTSRIAVDIQSNRFPETVQVQLFKSVPGGSVLVATSTQTLPVRDRVTTVLFSYTFTPADAFIGKVTFRAVATILGGRDALPADNVAIGDPTKVIR